MQIERLQIIGYKHLAGEFLLGEEITVVTGPNECGKSTFHSAMTRCMFGFSPRERRQSGGRSGRGQCRPWDGSPFRATMVALTETGRGVRISWDFDDDAVTVHDVATGERLLREAPRQRQDFSIGREFFGISREEHQQLSCLFQSVLEPVEPDEGLRQSLQRAVEATAADERGVDEADANLAGRLGSIGVHAGHYGLLPQGTMRSVEQQIDQLENELQVAQAGRAELDRLAATEAIQQLELEALEIDAVQLEQGRIQEQVSACTDVLVEARKLDREISRNEHVQVTLPADLPGRVASARDALSDATEGREAAAQRAAGADLGDLQHDLRAAEAAVDELAPYASVSLADEEVVRMDLATVTSSIGSAQPEPPPPRDPLLERFRTDGVPAGDSATSGGSTWASAIAVLLLLIGLVVGLVVTPLGFALTALAVVLGVTALRGLVRKGRSAGMFEEHPVAELRARLEAEDRKWAEYEGARTEYERLAGGTRSAKREAEERLQEILDQCLPGNEPLTSRGSAYLQQCDKHRSWLEAQGRSEKLRQEYRAASEPQRQLRTATEDQDRAEAELRRLLAQVGIKDPDLESGVGAFEAVVEKETTARENAERLAAATGRLEQLLAGRSLDELDEEKTIAEEALAEHKKRHGMLEDRPLAWTDPEALAKERTAVSAAIAELRARRDERELSLGDPADIELQLDSLRSKHAKLTLAKDAVRIAREELRAAATEAHRRVAPHLNAALKRELPRITRGRYSDAMVDEDLTIRVVVPETGGIAEIEELSRGTQDQIALVERIELARILYPEGSAAPLLLDDCFAHTDEFRLPLVMELLAEVAASRQVVLFSDDIRVVQAIRSMNDSYVVIELPDPVDSLQLTGAP